MNLISIIIPTNKPFAIWQPLLASISSQSYQEIEVVLIIDRMINGREFDTISRQVHQMLDQTMIQVSLITNQNTSFVAAKGASYVRNYGSEVAIGGYAQYMDDDGILEPDYIQNMVYRYDEGFTILGKPYITSPTIMYRDTGHIQSQGFDRIRRMMCRPEPHYSTDIKSRRWKHITSGFITQQTSPLPRSSMIVCMGAMGLFAPRELFQVIKFDERMGFVYEDLDMTLRATQAGIPLIVRHDITVKHMEIAKTLAQVSYVGSSRMVYLKSRNRILFVRNNAHGLDKVIFYVIGLPLQLIWFMVMIIIFGEQKLSSLWQLFIGTRDGLMMK